MCANLPELNTGAVIHFSEWQLWLRSQLKSWHRACYLTDTSTTTAAAAAGGIAATGGTAAGDDVATDDKIAAADDQLFRCNVVSWGDLTSLY